MPKRVNPGGPTDTEIWKPVENFPGYEISNLGNVRSYKRRYWLKDFPRILQPETDKDGYRRVLLCRQKERIHFFIHHLVLEAFIGPRPSDYYISNHKDGIKANNKYSNLEWTTPSENMKHAFRLGLQTLKGIMNTGAKLRDEEVLEMRRLAKLGVKRKVLAQMFKIHEMHVGNIVRRKSWSHI